MSVSEWIGAIGLVLGLLGIWLTFRSRRTKLLRYAVRSSNLIHDWQSRLPHLSIKYKDEPVENLTLTQIALWNGGGEVVEREDWPERDRLRISTSGEARILDCLL